MQRTLIALIAGLVVFGGVVASASSLGGVSSRALGSGASVVASCDTDGVALAYTTAFDAPSGTYRVSAVTVSGIAAACSGQQIEVALRNSAGTTSVSTARTTVSGTSQSLTVDPTYDAAAVDSASVLILAP
jgi:hypothetical protein